MDDPFASIILECIIPPEAEEALRHAPEIVESCFSPVICSLDGQSFGTAPNPDTPSEIQMLPDSPSSPLHNEGLRGIAARNGSSALRQPLFRLVDFTALIKYLSQNSDRSLANLDILEIAESKGISFPPPKWWRPGGYERVP